MVTSTGVPSHPFAVGVMEYVAVPGVDPVVVRFCAIEFPLPFDAPVTPDGETVHLKVVPETEPEREVFVASEEQMVCDEGDGVTSGVGLTVIEKVSALPEQSTSPFE